MAPFDPYHKWLGIPPEEQPPNHYRLLGLPQFESDADVIEMAAEQRTLLLRTFQTGPNSELAERLLNEVSEARLCLLSTEDKTGYDKQLQSTSEPGQPVVAEDTSTKEKDWTFATVKLPDDKDRRLVEPEQLPPLDQDPLGYAPDELSPTGGPATSDGRTRGKQEKPFWQEPWAIPAAAGGVVAVVLLLMLMLLTSGGDPSSPGDKPELADQQDGTVTSEQDEDQQAKIASEKAAAEKAAILAGAPITNTIGMTFNEIPAGTFMMGSLEAEAHRGKDEHQHKVTISKAFYMQTTVVTQGQWKAVMGTEPWKGKKYVKEGANYPAVWVSWGDAVAYCKKLSEKEGKTYRLPTEAQWEYGCRSGTKTTWSFGNDEKALGNHAWYGKNAYYAGEQHAHQVGLNNSNAFGLYDMHGNVYEWCHDYYGEDYYKQSPEKDPTGPASGSFRVVRGGAWHQGWPRTRSAWRLGYDAARAEHVFGFRVVRELDN